MDSQFIAVILAFGALIFAALYSAMSKKNPPVQEMEHLPIQVKYPEPLMPTSTPVLTGREKLYQTALACLGKDMSPADVAPDSLACAESINGVYKACFGGFIGIGAELTSTFALWKRLLADPRFTEVTEPLAGDIVISPTGTSHTGAGLHGHTGIWGNHDVMSNDSSTGKWTDNYTHQAWYDVFQKRLGFPVYFFRVRDGVK